ncbi:hypothetical protein PR202_gb07812 [Eleusine coracana subsp. coracana]|uniref:DUF7910 domain-containing protein n=1 Tax=Eleusine coracana subsp. coracana TaxID=191504 RepID=A0AAV5ED59_ELECO|nr:hypothetical protein PR202_gb07812 [Eleusine coracana subsp. coracana]
MRHRRRGDTGGGRRCWRMDSTGGGRRWRRAAPEGEAPEEGDGAGKRETLEEGRAGGGLQQRWEALEEGDNAGGGGRLGERVRKGERGSERVTMSSTGTMVVRLALLLLCSSGLLPRLAAAPGRPIRAVNLGGWLVTEGWIMPSLFDGIPNKDLLDGTKLQFKSVVQNRYLAANQGGGAAIVADRTQASSWETFRLWSFNATSFNFRVFGGQFWSVNSTGAVVATATSPGPSETFQIVCWDANTTRVRIRASNGLFLQAKTMQSLTADRGVATDWSDSDPSVFFANNVDILRGEYQICNGYGITNATKVLTNHWSTYINESDFSFMSSNGLNAVRIPVGWWIASDPNPPLPFVGGSLKALDNAFVWSQ